MSVFTMTLGEVIDLYGEDNIGLDTYPAISETHRERINRTIIDNFLNREIGLETVSMWRHNMRRKMNLIMPMYNELYKTQTLIVDPLRTVDLKTLSTSKRELDRENTQTDSVNSGSKTRNVNAETPQVFLSGQGNYATSAQDTRADSIASTSSDQSGSETSEDVMDSTTTGFQGSQADLILAYRATIINVDMMILADVEELFIGVYDFSSPIYKRGILY